MKNPGISILTQLLPQLPQFLLTLIGYCANVCDIVNIFIEFPALLDTITRYIDILDNTYEFMKILSFWYAKSKVPSLRSQIF